MEQWEVDQEREEFIKDFYYNNLNFCGCGSPSDILYVIKNFLNVVKRKSDRQELKDYNKNHYEYYELYKKEVIESLNLIGDKKDGNFYAAEGVIQVFYNILNNCDVLEHGSSVGGSWLTEYGLEVLEHLNSLNDEELEYILD